MKVYFEKEAYDEEEQYELPELLVTDLNEGGRMRLKVKFIVISSSVNMWQLKRKQAKVMDGVLRLLHEQKPDEIRSRDELRCEVRNEIMAAIQFEE